MGTRWVQVSMCEVILKWVLYKLIEWRFHGYGTVIPYEMLGCRNTKLLLLRMRRPKRTEGKKRKKKEAKVFILWTLYSQKDH